MLIESRVTPTRNIPELTHRAHNAAPRLSISLLSSHINLRWISLTACDVSVLKHEACLRCLLKDLHVREAHYKPHWLQAWAKKHLCNSFARPAAVGHLMAVIPGFSAPAVFTIDFLQKTWTCSAATNLCLSFLFHLFPQPHGETSSPSLHQITCPSRKFIERCVKESLVFPQGQTKLSSTFS